MNKLKAQKYGFVEEKEVKPEGGSYPTTEL